MTGTLSIVGIVALLLGAVIGYIIRQMKVTSSANAEVKLLEAKGKEIVEKAKDKADRVRKEAKNDAKEIVSEERKNLESEFKARMADANQKERELAKLEASLEAKTDNFKETQERVRLKEDDLFNQQRKVEEEIKKFKEKQNDIADKLTEVAGMSREAAKDLLLQTLTEEAKVDAAKEIRRIEEEAKEEAEKKGKRILAIACQRFAGEYIAEDTITSVDLPGDEIKGRLIGREGRNIRAFEQICGVDMIIDDTPGVVVLSAFNVVRREIARMTIERLISDGRIHPAKIEEFYEKSKGEFESRLRELGEKAQMEIGVHGIHPEVLKMIGALNWRTSYTQNQYQHSLEVAFLCGAMASELGMNVKQARRAGLLHDIGKVMDASMEGSHAVVGADFLKKYGESPDIVHAIRAHHEDVKPETILAHLVMAGDALSGGRPGIRKALKESYVSRLTDIENIVNSFEGVSKSYAISAGREIRVMVENSKVSDDEIVILSRDIAKKIEEELSYPGTIKINVLRQTQAIGVAR